MSAPEINATTLSHIVSAPNHVRCWSADFYRALGGHDPSLPIADDYDLVVRSLVAGEFCHIPKMLYRQHIGPNTAQRQRNGLIQELVVQIAEKYRSDIERRFG